MKLSLVCVGDNVADFYNKKKRFYPGGSAYNVAILSKRLGVDTAYLGTFGTDGPGEYLVEFLEKENVDISHISVLEGNNAFSVVKEVEGRSEIVKVDKGVYKNFCLSEKDLDFIESFDLLHTTFYSYTEEYLPIFKEKGLKVSFDFSFCRDKNYLKKTVPYVDLAFFSGEKDNKEKLKELMTFIYNLGAKYVIFTLGEKGVMALYNDKYFYQEAKEIEVIDSLGAGDAFISMFLNNFNFKDSIRESDFKKILKKSVDFAAKNCKHYGTIKIRR